MHTYPGAYADSIILDSRIAMWEMAERAHAQAPSDQTDAARKLAAKRVDQQRKLIARRTAAK